MKQLFEEWNPSGDSLVVVKRANGIVAKYAAMKITLTIRQLYYQFVQQNWLKNTERNYKRLIDLMARARLAGLTDWSAIEDRTRNLSSLTAWSSPSEMIEVQAANFRFDLWADQPNRVEVWIEKEALASVFEQICRQLRVDFMCCRGYMSLSELYDAGQRLKLRRSGRSIYGDEHAKQRNVILHFGDHDPSGMDMTRNIEERLRQFSEGPVKLIRCALNMDQIEQYDPPPNPAKITDSRFEKYAEEYGNESWELDALDPLVLRGLVATHVAEYQNSELFKAADRKERNARTVLKAIAGNWVVAETAVRNEVDVLDYDEDRPDDTGNDE